MNVFHKVARESLKKNRTRTFVTILGVILSAALITGVCSFGYSLLCTMADASAVRYGDWHLAVTGVNDAFCVEQVQHPQVATVSSFANVGVAQLTGCKSEDDALLIAGFSEEAFDTLPLTLLSGRLPHDGTEILLPANLASSGGVGWKVSETVSLLGKNYTVTGICAKLPIAEKLICGYMAITCDDGATASKTAFVKLENPYSIRSYADQLGYDSFYNEEVLRFKGIWEDGSDSVLITLMLAVGVVVIGIIMVGSVFLIFNAFNISLNERTHQVGILASVGATPRQLRRSVLYEGLCIGAIGIPVGVLAGLGAIRLVIAAVADSFGNIFSANVKLSLILSVPVIAGAVVISLITILISAYLPAKRAAKTPIMECIRQTNEIKASAKTVKTSRLSERLWGLEGTLALKNFKRNKKQYRSIVLSLVLSILLFVVTSSFVDSLSSISDTAGMVTDYEVGFGTDEMGDEELSALFGDFKCIDGVTSCRLQAVYDLPCVTEAANTATGADMLSATVQFIDNDSFRSILRDLGLPEEEYFGDTPHFLTSAKLPDEDQTKTVTELQNLFTADTVEVELGGQTVLLTSLNSLLPDIPPNTKVIAETENYIEVAAPWRWKELVADEHEPRVKGVTIRTDKPGETAQEMQNVIQGQSITESYLLLDSTKLLSENRSYVFIANVFSYTFLVMITLIAVANVFNTISTNIKLRRRELAMIRSVGMGDRSFQRMMRFECVFYGLQAMLFGIPLSLILSYLTQKVMLDGVIDANAVRFDVPWLPLAISIGGVLCIIFVTMMYTVNKLKRENIIDALRDEMA